MISRINLSGTVRNKKELYKACQRNEFVMPSMKCSLCTIDFMFEVKAGKIYCPKIKDLKGRKACPDPPDIKTLLTFISAAVMKHEANQSLANFEKVQLSALLERLDKKQCNKEWLIDVLWCLDESHPIFEKNYVYRRPKDNHVEFMQLIPNENNFFDGLPEMTRE